MDFPQSVYDVIIIGAGISGLYSARCLKEEGLKFIVLEARDRVGGRTCSSKESFGYADMGGAYFGHHQKEVITLAKELGLKFYNVPEHGKTTMNYKGRISHFKGDIPSANNILELLDLVSAIKELDQLSLKVPLLEPWKASLATELDAVSALEFLDQICWTDFSKMLIDIALSAVFALPSSNVSLLYTLHLIRSCGGTRALFDQKGGLQEMKLIEGADSISKKMAEQLQSELRLNVRVKKISQDADEVLVVTDDNSVLRAKAVIVAASPAVLKHIQWLPNLPAHLQSFLDLNLMNCPYFKTVTYYERPYWETKGLNGSLVSTKGIVKVAYPDTKHDGSFPSIMGFLLNEENQHWTFEERKTAVAKHYAQQFGIEAMATPTGYLEKWWNDPVEYHSSGPCVFALPPKFITNHQVLWGEPFGRVYFAGSESSAIFRGYMDGGVRAGAMATKQILHDLSLKPKRDYSRLLEPVPYMELSIVERLLPGVSQLLWVSLMLVALVVVTLVSYILR